MLWRSRIKKEKRGRERETGDKRWPSEDCAPIRNLGCRGRVRERDDGLTSPVLNKVKKEVGLFSTPLVRWWALQNEVCELKTELVEMVGL